jgi:hypothetical protein
VDHRFDFDEALEDDELQLEQADLAKLELLSQFGAELGVELARDTALANAEAAAAAAVGGVDDHDVVLAEPVDPARELDASAIEHLSDHGDGDDSDGGFEDLSAAVHLREHEEA